MKSAYHGCSFMLDGQRNNQVLLPLDYATGDRIVHRIDSP
jgi:hypothetical protein